MNESIDVVILHKHQEDWPVTTGPGEVLITRWKVPVLQELLNTRMNNLYVEGFDDYVITEMINMLCDE